MNGAGNLFKKRGRTRGSGAGGERPSLDERHRVIEAPLRLARVEDRHDVRMADPRRHLRLATESRRGSGARFVLPQHLERDLGAAVLGPVAEYTAARSPGDFREE